MLGVLGVDTTPILAGAGILGLAGGLGAQSLVTDVVSGFFILFENQYLVGDYHPDRRRRRPRRGRQHPPTQIRDEQGQLHIIPNGQIKNVINFSKGYVNAAVDVKLPSSPNLEAVFRTHDRSRPPAPPAPQGSPRRHRLKGLVDLTPSDMVVRAVTQVQPGTTRRWRTSIGGC